MQPVNASEARPVTEIRQAGGFSGSGGIRRISKRREKGQPPVESWPEGDGLNLTSEFSNWQ
jgi:hypothetical protein